MKISITKITDKIAQVFIGVATYPASKQYELIKKCKDVKWDASLKLWILPHTVDHWLNFKTVFEGYSIEERKEDTLHLIQGKKIKKCTEVITHNILPKRRLNEVQYNALLRLKLYMVIKRQADRQ